MSTYAIPQPSGGDITDLIAADHRMLEDLMRAMRDESADRDAARTAFSDLLVAHSEAEEEIVYPRLKSRAVIAGEEEEHGEEEHAATNEALLRLLEVGEAGGEDFDQAVEAVAEVLNHHIGEEELSILNPAREDASEELRERLGAAWAERRSALLEDGCGSQQNVERIVRRAFRDGVLPNDEQPEG